MPPPKIWMPNFPIRLKLKPPPRTQASVEMPQPGTEGTFRTHEVVLETVQNLTKIEMWRFLESVYGMDIKDIHSLNVMGRRRNESTIMARKAKDFKRFYVRLNAAVDLPNVPKQIDELNAQK